MKMFIIRSITCSTLAYSRVSREGCLANKQIKVKTGICGLGFPEQNCYQPPNITISK